MSKGPVPREATMYDQVQKLLEARDEAVRQYPHLFEADWQWGLSGNANIVMHNGEDVKGIGIVDRASIATALIQFNNAAEELKKLLALAQQALHTHNSVAHYAHTQSAKDQAVAMCNKHNLESMLIEFFGQDRVTSEPPTLVDTSLCIARLIEYNIHEVYWRPTDYEPDEVDAHGNGEIEVAVMPFRWREKV